MSTKFIWFPLSLAVFGSYAIQHGLTTLGKTSLVVPWFMQGLSIFFIALSVGMFFIGPLLDNISSRKAMIAAVILGIGGIIGLNYSPYMFGILFGLSGALIKVIPFSGPMKLINKNEAIAICPQGAAKNIGSIFFLLFLSSLLLQWGWGLSTIILAFVFGLSGLLTYLIMPDDKIEGWKWSIFLKLAKDWKFWILLVINCAQCAGYYWAIPQFIPAIKACGFSTQTSVYINSGLLVLAALSRWPNAWLGIKFGHQNMLIACGVLMPLIIWFVLPFNPIVATALFQPVGAIPTVNYWPAYKERWGATYISTVSCLMFIGMYLATGLLLGKWSM
jgi:MFS family permease